MPRKTLPFAVGKKDWMQSRYLENDAMDDTICLIKARHSSLRAGGVTFRHRAVRSSYFAGCEAQKVSAFLFQCSSSSTVAADERFSRAFWDTQSFQLYALLLRAVLLGSPVGHMLTSYSGQYLPPDNAAAALLSSKLETLCRNTLSKPRGDLFEHSNFAQQDMT